MDKLDKKFLNEMEAVYDTLWRMYKGPTGNGCEWDTERESVILKAINLIDDEMQKYRDEEGGRGRNEEK